MIIPAASTGHVMEIDVGHIALELLESDDTQASR